MKALLPALALSSLLFGPFPQDQEGHDEPETELAGHMEKIEDTVKVLRKNLKDDAGRPAALAALAEIEALSLECKQLIPAMAGRLPEAERAAFVTAYRRSMVDFLMRELELEAALLDGDAEKTKAAFDRFREMEDSAHERFAPEDG